MVRHWAFPCTHPNPKPVKNIEKIEKNGYFWLRAIFEAYKPRAIQKAFVWPPITRLTHSSNHFLFGLQRVFGFLALCTTFFSKMGTDRPNTNPISKGNHECFDPKEDGVWLWLWVWVTTWISQTGASCCIFLGTRDPVLPVYKKKCISVDTSLKVTQYCVFFLSILDHKSSSLETFKQGCTTFGTGFNPIFEIFEIFWPIWFSPMFLSVFFF